jgi:hypothetical protein
MPFYLSYCYLGLPGGQENPLFLSFYLSHPAIKEWFTNHSSGTSICLATAELRDVLLPLLLSGQVAPAPQT